MRRVVMISLLGMLLAGTAGAAVAASPTDAGLLEALRSGGLNLYFRHAATEWSQDDHVRQAGDWRSCETQRMRQLSEAGRRTARAVGEAMRELGIPVGAVLASPYCRTLETARLLGLGPVQTTTDVMNLRVSEYFGGRDAVVARTRARLSTPPAPGTNNVYVAHGNVARQATEIYPGEAECLVFRPDAFGGFAFVGRIPPRKWRRLAVVADERRAAAAAGTRPDGAGIPRTATHGSHRRRTCVDEGPGLGFARVCEQSLARALLDEAATVQECRVPCDTRGVRQFVGREHHRMGRGKREDQVLDALRRDRVEAREGFVEEQNLRLVGERPGKAQTLLLPDGELGRLRSQPSGHLVPKPDPLE